MPILYNYIPYLICYISPLYSVCFTYIHKHIFASHIAPFHSSALPESFLGDLHSALYLYRHLCMYIHACTIFVISLYVCLPLPTAPLAPHTPTFMLLLLLPLFLLLLLLAFSTVWFCAFLHACLKLSGFAASVPLSHCLSVRQGDHIRAILADRPSQYSFALAFHIANSYSHSFIS